MTEPTKTTVYLDSDDYRRLKAIARARECSTAHLVREAVAEYARSQPPPARPSSIGAGRSGRHDRSDRAEELLAGLGETPA